MSVDDIVFFKWSPEYSVNVETIDAQHLELVNILNRLFVAVWKREGEKAIVGMLDVLMVYVRTHFALEERLLQQAKYQDFDAHKLEHDRLLEQLDQMYGKHFLEDKAIHFQMLGFIKTWLKEHILGGDRKYGAALQQAAFPASLWANEATNEFARMSEWWEVWKAV
jgi:hemerythrin